jgi:hypothetical protein
MRQHLEVVQHNIADWQSAVDATMNARAAAIAAANTDLDLKIQAAKAKLIVPQNTYLREKKFFKRKIWRSKKTQEKMDRITQEYEYAKEIVTKLEKAKVLIANLQRDDLIRQAEITVQNDKITPLSTDLSGKLTRGEVWDAADNENYKKIGIAHDVISDIHDQILKNTQQIELCHRLATTYDDAHPEQFPAHWLTIASAIVEQEDKYGFKGEIDHRDLNTSKTPGSGLEGYSTSYGAILKEAEVIRYTLPGSKVLLEQHHNGRIIDKTPVSENRQNKALAAIKTAHLLLLDQALHPNKKIYLHGSADYLPQVQMVVAALLAQAKLSGIVLKLSDLDIQVPGWTNWRSSTVESEAEITVLEPEMERLIGHHHAQNELKEKIRHIKGQTMVVDEPTHPPRRR